MSQTTVTASTTQDFTAEDIAQVKKLLNFSKSITDSLNTSAIAKLAQTASSLAIMLEHINTPEMMKLIERLSEMSKDGTIDNLLEMADFIIAIKRSMSTDIIVKMTQLLPDPKLITTAEKLMDAVTETKDQMDNNPKNVGVFSLLGVLKDPDVQYLLGFLIELSKKSSKIIRD